MICFGGVTQGGYRGDVAQTAELLVTVSHGHGESPGNGTTYDLEWSERQLDPDDDDALPISRGYHSACVREAEPSVIVVYGGLHGGGPLDDVVRFDADAFEWSAVETVGPRPAARWAHSACFIGDRMWVVGGGDGSDLLRSGDDFVDVHALDFGVDPPRWAPVDVSASCSVPRVMGKCHTATLVGRNIVCLAGGMDFSDELWVLNTSRAATSPAINRPDEDGCHGDDTDGIERAEWLRPTEYGEPDDGGEASRYYDPAASDSEEEWLLGGGEPDSEGASSGSDDSDTEYSDAEFYDAPSPPDAAPAPAPAPATNTPQDAATDGATDGASATAAEAGPADAAPARATVALQDAATDGATDGASATAAAAGPADASPEAGPEADKDPGPGRKRIGALSHTAVGVAGGRLIVYGGYGASQRALADTWEISLGCAEGGPSLAGKQPVGNTAAFGRGRPPRGLQELLAMVSTAALPVWHCSFAGPALAVTGFSSLLPNLAIPYHKSITNYRNLFLAQFFYSWRLLTLLKTLGLTISPLSCSLLTAPWRNAGMITAASPHLCRFTRIVFANVPLRGRGPRAVPLNKTLTD